MNKKEETKKYIIEKYQISEQEFDETYEVYSNLINFLQDMDLVHEFNDKVDDVLTVDNDICMGIFLDIVKIKKIGLAMFLDYVYVLYTAMQGSSIVGSYLKAIKDFFDRLAFYSKDGADMLKEHVKNAFSYPLELVLVYKYEKVMNSKYVPDYYKIIIDLYKKIYKKYDALENGFMCYLLNESFDYFVLNESFKRRNIL